VLSFFPISKKFPIPKHIQLPHAYNNVSEPNRSKPLPDRTRPYPTVKLPCRTVPDRKTTVHDSNRPNPTVPDRSGPLNNRIGPNRTIKTTIHDRTRSLKNYSGPNRTLKQPYPLKESSSVGLIDTILNVDGKKVFYLQLYCIISKIKKLKKH
jgi:hypothetical protein